MVMDDDEYDDFIGWKLEDISEILHSLSGLEIPEDPHSDWTEPTNGGTLADYLIKTHSIKLAWSFAVPNPRQHGPPFAGELGTLLVGVDVNPSSIDSTKLEAIHNFHKMLLTVNENVRNPMYVAITDIEYGTVIAPWWK
jgi:hypothetical protein